MFHGFDGQFMVFVIETLVGCVLLSVWSFVCERSNLLSNMLEGVHQWRVMKQWLLYLSYSTQIICNLVWKLHLRKMQIGIGVSCL